MRLTVLTTTYNMVGTLAEACESVRTQTRLPDCHVIVDDGSTDETRAFVLRYASEAAYPVAATFLMPNCGHAAALNAGVRLTREYTDWYVKLDADDRLFSDALARIERHAVGDTNVVYATFRLFGAFTHYFRFPSFDPMTMTEECQIPGPAAFDAALWDAVAGFDETMRYGEDWDFWIRAQLAVGLRPKYLLDPLWHYRTYRNWAERHADQPFQDRFKDYWRGHTRETVLAGSRSWGAWIAEQMVGA